MNEATGTARILMFALILAITGCVSTYTENRLIAPSIKLSRSTPVVIATSENGRYGTIDYPSSGRMTADAIKSSFIALANDVSILTTCKNLLCLKSETKTAPVYFVVPEIIHWEDRNTEWSGIPDRIEVKISVFNDQDPKPLASALITGKSKWATFGGDHPQDLLPEPISKFVKSLY